MTTLWQWLGTLDEKGFVFLGNDGNAYRCCIWGDNAWLFVWHPTNTWVSVRKLTQVDVWMLPHNLTEVQQELYYAIGNENGVKFYREAK